MATKTTKSQTEKPNPMDLLKFPVFTPKLGNTYWYITEIDFGKRNLGCVMCQWQDTEKDRLMFKIGNIFLNPDQAKLYMGLVLLNCAMKGVGVFNIKGVLSIKSPADKDNIGKSDGYVCNEDNSLEMLHSEHISIEADYDNDNTETDAIPAEPSEMDKYLDEFIMSHADEIFQHNKKYYQEQAKAKNPEVDTNGFTPLEVRCLEMLKNNVVQNVLYQLELRITPNNIHRITEIAVNLEISETEDTEEAKDKDTEA